ncbi:MAG: hypothetical protein ACRBN8_12675 [Nannocystales bacterium]
MARGVAAFTLVALLGCDSDAGDGGDTDAGSSGRVEPTATDGASAGPTTDSQSSTSGQDGTSSDGPQTSTDDGSTSGGPTETEGSTGEPEGVPVVVSLAHGGQTARSCDGQSWTDFHEFGIQDDHSDYAAFGGLTFGNGAFVAATGWGAPAHILRSTDGVTWEDLSDEAFVTPEGVARPGNGASGVEFVGDEFVLLAGSYLWRSADGNTWTAEQPETLSYSGHFREVEYLPEPGLLLIATEAYEAQQSWTIQVSADGGATWHSGTGATAECVGYVQHVGGFTAHDGRLLIGGGAGPTCVSDDGGLTWVEAGNVGSEIADVASYEGGFLALVQSGEVFASEDGEAWAPLGNAGLDGGRLGWHPELGFFGEGGAVYAHSPDGATWTDAASQPPEGFIHVREFAVGRLPSCP